MIKTTARYKIPNNKYLRRALVLSDGYFDEATNKLKMINKKRLHIRDLLIAAPNDEKRNHICLKKKLFKNFLHAQFNSFSHYYWLEDLKHAKRLAKCHYRPHQANSLTYFKRLNKNLEIVKFVNPHEDSRFSYGINKLSKAVGGLPKLKIYQEHRFPNQKNDKEEFQTLHRYLARLPKVEHFEFLLYNNKGQLAVRDIMDEEEVKTYEKLTSLWVGISLFLGEQIAPLFQFQMFPNLRQLSFKADSHVSGLGPFVLKAFENLPNLEKFQLNVNSHLPGVNFIFEGLGRLPQLTSFSLRANFLTSENWSALIKFMQNQCNLIHLNFAISECDPSEQHFMENFLESLSYRPKLQSLAFRYFHHDLLPAFSRGFKRIIGTENLKYFSIEESSIEKKFQVPQAFEGLCDFHMKNRNTLVELKIETPSPFLQGCLGALISQLNQLKSLYLIFCEDRSSDEFLSLSFECFLEKLEKLEDLTVDFRSFQGDSQIVNFLKALGSSRSLRNLSFDVPEDEFEVSEDGIGMISRALEDLKFVNICFGNYKHYDDESDLKVNSIREISRAFERLWKEQSFAVNLSFLIP